MKTNGCFPIPAQSRRGAATVPMTLSETYPGGHYSVQVSHLPCHHPPAVSCTDILIPTNIH